MGTDILEMQKEVHNTAKSKGWHSHGKTSEEIWKDKNMVPTWLCLIHSEVSEALEAFRHQDFANFEEELADIVIRVFDTAEALDIPMDAAIVGKNEYNKTREHRHGGKKV